MVSRSSTRYQISNCPQRRGSWNPWGSIIWLQMAECLNTLLQMSLERHNFFLHLESGDDRPNSRHRDRFRVVPDLLESLAVDVLEIQ